METNKSDVQKEKVKHDGIFYPVWLGNEPEIYVWVQLRTYDEENICILYELKLCNMEEMCILRSLLMKSYKSMSFISLPTPKWRLLRCELYEVKPD